MSRRRDREKRVRRLLDRPDADGMWDRGAFRPIAPGSREHCGHDPSEYAAAGWMCPEHEGGACLAEIPF